MRWWTFTDMDGEHEGAQVWVDLDSVVCVRPLGQGMTLLILSGGVEVRVNEEVARVMRKLEGPR